MDRVSDYHLTLKAVDQRKVQKSSIWKCDRSQACHAIMGQYMELQSAEKQHDVQ